MSNSLLPKQAVINEVFSENFDSEVVLIDSVPVSPGDEFNLVFEEKCSNWRQGVWFGVDGLIEVEGEQNASMRIWEDNSPDMIRIKVIEADGFLHIYNIWDRGFGPSSQAHTSGMIVEEFGVTRRYRCQSINVQPSFDDITFRIEKMT